MAHLLVVDDKEGFRDMLAIAFAEGPHQVQSASCGEAALALLAVEHFDVVITDLRLGDRSGLEVLRAARDLEDAPEVILITAHGTIGDAVDAMKHGALDFLEKPFDLAELEARVDKALERRRLVRENQALKDAAVEPSRRLIGRSLADLRAMIAKVADARTPVLITGESGTGKEQVAREIHERSCRRDRPFVAVNCAALAESLLESELFGHEEGAFTGARGLRKGRFELAEDGTLFLDEIGELSPAIQIKLLRVLQERSLERVGGAQPIPVQARMVAASNRDLKQAIARGAFREDLYYRINVITLHVPPLRERPEDIAVLTEHFLDRANLQMHKRVQCPPEVLQVLTLHTWPGNVRELENVIERGVVLADGDHLRLADLPEDIVRRGARMARPSGAGSALDGVRDIERELVRQALDQHGWNQSRAARELGLSRTSLQYKMKKYDLEPPRER